MKTLQLNSLAAPNGNAKAHDVLEEMRKRALENASKEPVDVDSDIVARLSLALIPGISEAVQENPGLVNYSYMMCYRTLTSLLPEDLRFSYIGARALNGALAASQEFAWKMDGAWKQISAVTLEGIAKQEARAQARRDDEQNRISKDDQEVIYAVQQELLNLIYEKPHRMSVTKSGKTLPLIKHYSELLSYLRGRMEGQYRGIRGVRCIHNAMLAQLAWSEHWHEWMAKDIEFFEQREREFIARMRSKRAARKAEKSVTQEPTETVPEDSAAGIENPVVELEEIQCPVLAAVRG